MNVIPFLREHKRLQVLCVDPGDIKALDEVAFVTGLTPDPIVVPEIRFWQLLKHFYGIERQLRFVTLSTQDYLSPVLMDQTEPETPSVKEDLISEENFVKLYHRRDGFPEVSRPPDSSSLPSEDMPFLSEEDLEVIEEDESPGPPGQIERRVWQALLVEDGNRKEDRNRQEADLPLGTTDDLEPDEQDLSPLAFSEATRLLELVTGRDAIARCVLRYSHSIFKRSMLFTIHRGVALGWDAIGDEIDRRQFRNLMIPLDNPSIFQLVVNSQSHYLGGIPKTESNIKFLRATGKQIPLSAFLLPILVSSRVVNVLYCDNGHKAHCPSDIGELLILAQQIRKSYESLFERQRKTFLQSLQGQT